MLRLTLLIMLLCGTGFAHIQRVAAMREILPIFEQADCSTLVIFDIDLVLMQPDDPVFQVANCTQHKQIAREVLTSLSHEEFDLFFTLMVVSTHSILIEDETPEYLNTLANRQIPTIALTSNLTGSLDQIPSLEEWKVGRLEQLGFDFKTTAPFTTPHTFLSLPSWRGFHSTHLDGVLFANGAVCPKGDVLVAYLEWSGLKPRRIIFIDDRLSNLENVQNALETYDSSIIYEGLHYAGAQHYPSEEVDADYFRARWEQLAASAKNCLIDEH